MIGELLAGIALGPSLLGHLAPALVAWLLPPDARSGLAMLAHVGVGLYMFLVGLDIRVDQVRARAGLALRVAPVAIGLPFLAGAALAAGPLQPWAGPAATPFTFRVLIGIALAITALPVLARLLRDQGLLGTDIGTTALTCAAVNDVTAWLGLFLLLGRGTAGAAVVFLAFVAGLLMPGHGAAAAWLRRALHWPVTLLLPAFFAVSGLRTVLGGIPGPPGWALTGTLTLAAMLGTGGGAALMGRSAGLPWREAARLGILLSTRGLMGLVVLNVALDAELIAAPLFAMLVVVTVVTTVATAPLLVLLGPALQSARAGAPAPGH